MGTKRIHTNGTTRSHESKGQGQPCYLANKVPLASRLLHKIGIKEPKDMTQLVRVETMEPWDHGKDTTWELGSKFDEAFVLASRQGFLSSRSPMSLEIWALA